VYNTGEVEFKLNEFVRKEKKIANKSNYSVHIDKNDNHNRILVIDQYDEVSVKSTVDFCANIISEEGLGMRTKERIDTKDANPRHVSIGSYDDQKIKMESKIIPLSKTQHEIYYGNKQKAHEMILKKASKDKRVRMPKDILLAHLFHLFKNKETMTAKDIVNAIDQPEGWIKETLLEICDIDRSVSKKGSYFLKKEYVANGFSSTEIGKK